MGKTGGKGRQRQRRRLAMGLVYLSLPFLMSWAMGFMASLVDTSILALALHREHISRDRAAGSVKVEKGP
jgi:hypothetical protein